MNKKSQIKIAVFLIICVIAMTFAVLAQDKLKELVKRPRVFGKITNDGPIDVGSQITFNGKCSGEGNLQLIICKENSICNSETEGKDLICSSDFLETEGKNCSYLTTEFDEGIHNNDVATCCNLEGECDTTVLRIDDWIVNVGEVQAVTVLDEVGEEVSSSVNRVGEETEIIFTDKEINKLSYDNLEDDVISFSTVARNIIEPENIKFVKFYSLDLENITFDKGTLYSTAVSSRLYKCNFWDFNLSLCLGEWEFERAISEGKEYSLKLEKGSIGYAEGYDLSKPSNATPGEVKIMGSITNNGPVAKGSAITFNGKCNGMDTKMVVCRRNIICNSETPEEDVLCKSDVTNEAGKSCSYLTSESDENVNENSVATCCNLEGECDTETKLIESWEVTTLIEDITVPVEVPIIKDIVQGEVEINKPVKWQKNIRLNESIAGLKVKVHPRISNVKVKKIVDGIESEISEDQFNLDERAEETEITIIEEIKDGGVEYYTEAPSIIEGEFVDNRKQVTISSAISYTDVVAYTTVPENPREKIKLYWLVNESRVLVENANYIDANSNGLIDKLEWIVPHLSDQVYEIVIEIIKAEHLDENRDFIRDQYDEVKALDGIWSEKIYHNEYLRVVFEQELTSENDITVYVRNLGGSNTKIEVYHKDTNNKITEFPVITNEEYYKVYLTGMGGSHDTFDLKIVDVDGEGSSYLEFDHVIDPISLGMCASVFACIDNSVSSVECTCSDVATIDNVLFGADAEGLTSKSGTLAIAGVNFTNSSLIPTGYTINSASFYITFSVTLMDALCTISYSIDDGSTWATLNDDCTGVAAETTQEYNISNLTEAQLEGFIANVTAIKSGAAGGWGYLAVEYANLTIDYASPPDNQAPFVNLTAPLDNNVTETGDVVFKTNGTDAEGNLKNATLYHNITGTWEANETQTVSGTFDAANFTIINDIPDGNIFIWNVLYCDTSHNCDWYYENWTVTVEYPDTTAPWVNLTSPADGNLTETGDINFTSNATDDGQNRGGLFNATLYHNITGTWEANESVEINGTFNETDFFINDIPDYNMIFIWNVLYCDNSSNCAFADQNRTVTVQYPDTTAPWVNLSEPADGNVTETGDVNFTSNATETGGWLLNATLYHNITGTWEANETVWINGTFNETDFFINDIPDGAGFIWNVFYCDNSSNCDWYYENWTVSVEYPDTTAPWVNLTSPADNNVTNTGDVNFTSNATDDGQNRGGLFNATLYHNITGTWEANESVEINGTFNETDFFINGIPDATVFIWNVLYCDNASSSNCDFAPSNRTVNVTIYTVIWNQTSIDLGSNGVANGNATGYVGVNASGGTHANVVVSCSSGDCDIMQTNWTTRSMDNGQNDAVEINCSNSSIGTFQAVFDVSSDEDTTVDQLTVDCVMDDLSAPTVTLNDPADDNLTATGDVTFNASAVENVELFNATLYHNITGTWEANETVFINGTSNETNFTINDIPNGNIFIWNVLYCDNSSNYNCAFASSNYTVNVLYPDTTAPWVNLSEPKDNNVTSTGNVTFKSNATETGGWLLNATLYHNITGTWEMNESVEINGTFNETNFTIYDIPNGNIFIWNVLYCDNSSNCAFGDENFTVSVQANNPPVVEAIVGPDGDWTIDDQDVVENGISDILVHFTVSDQQGWEDINSSTANLTLIDEDGSSSDISYNTSCQNLGNLDANTLNFSCSIETWYWYDADTWNITAGIMDNSSVPDDNTTNFTLGTTTAIVISPNQVTFPELTMGGVNISSDSDPIIINNTANYDVTAGNVRVKGYDLVGEVNNSYVILTANFTMNRTDDCYGTPLANNSAEAIADTVVTAANRSVLGEGNETLYLCINEVPYGLLPQAYSTLNGTAWVIDVQ